MISRTIPHVSDAKTFDVLLVHAPYPGKLMFDSHPTSLLHSVAVFAVREELPGELAYLDPGTPSKSFDAELESAAKRTRVALISTSTAAIEETAKIVARIRAAAGSRVLVIIGGPHEDDVPQKAAYRIEGVDLSIGGDAEFLLDAVLTAFLNSNLDPETFCLSRMEAIARKTLGTGTIASPWWGRVEGDHGGQRFGTSRIPLAQIPPRPVIDKVVRFKVLDAPRTIPITVSRGCAYGQCSFCAEGIIGRQETLVDLDLLEQELDRQPDASVYFQDSLFPFGPEAEAKLLPLLKSSGRPWGCQVYLKMLTPRKLALLVNHGCTYLYTGVESASDVILRGIGKRGLSAPVILERTQWIQDQGCSLGLSLMFGAMSERGELLETADSILSTVALAQEVSERAPNRTFVYPNVLTLLPGTRLAQALEAQRGAINWYAMPMTDEFAHLEDGGVGWNFMSLEPSKRTRELSNILRAASEALVDS